MTFKTHKIIDTDNFGGDYPDEKELCWVDAKGAILRIVLSEEHAKELAEILNRSFGNGLRSSRHIRHTNMSKKLEGPFEI